VEQAFMPAEPAKMTGFSRRGKTGPLKSIGKDKKEEPIQVPLFHDHFLAILLGRCG
jgi:hypothetical protein